MLIRSTGMFIAAFMIPSWIRGIKSYRCRKFSVQLTQARKLPSRYLGQPSSFTHPHLLKPGEVTPGLSLSEYALRRYQLMHLIKEEVKATGTVGNTDHAVIFLSNPTCYMTNDIPYQFHQNTNFLYLCGFQEPDSILMLKTAPGKDLPDHKSILFVPKRDQNRELWDGPRSGVDGAAALTGVDLVYTTEDFKLLVQKLKDEGITIWYDATKPTHPQLHCDYLKPLLESRSQYKNKIRAVRHLVQNLRLFKSEAEIELMKNAGRITSQFDYECRARGADILAYPPVVAGGNRSNILHYVKNNQLIQDGEMVLLDGGCESFGYVSDVTRTWPINGRFTGPQAEVYQAVLDIQKSCLSLCSVGISLENIYTLMLTMLAQNLTELGICQKKLNNDEVFKAARKYCPHHVGHYLGMDVHDTPDISRSLSLQPGMVITIEPGIYIPEDDTEAPRKFQGVGVRIEDDVVITEEGPLILSADCPKEIQDIEGICSSRK
ncbi:xaa-Pro aminopeptidase 3 isoform X2 [Protopterus annectens]|uniref:xaa-Pro aminopeptidase 3 isoform X2 n=1 Tax=Protopterus annectens TaxID=7888 RepID=UPI001CF9C844|nr:xaa-Pro aminopeptidase 3 isoform X2 [Protopterus annectens]